VAQITISANRSLVIVPWRWWSCVRGAAPLLFDGNAVRPNAWIRLLSSTHGAGGTTLRAHVQPDGLADLSSDCGSFETVDVLTIGGFRRAAAHMRRTNGGAAVWWPRACQPAY
jgi:hypothetical protein